MLIFAVSIALCVPCADDAQLPGELQRTLAMRMAMRTGHMRYRLITSGLLPERVKNCECRTSGASFLVTNYGDDDGIMGMDRDIKAVLGRPFACSPRDQLMDRDSGENWTYVHNDSGIGRHSAESPDAYDIRMIGMECYPLLHFAEDLSEVWLSYFPNKDDWHVEHLNQLVHVEASREFKKEENIAKHRQTWRWTIDPAKDNALLELDILVHEEGQPQKQWGNAQTEYKVIDHHWFPAKCSAWRVGDKGGVWRAEYELLEADFDRPEHPKKISMELLPVVSGSWVLNTVTGERLVWDGSTAIPRQKWLEIRAATGNRELETLIVKNREADDYRYPSWWYDKTEKLGVAELEFKPDEWEAYVRRWCLKNDVDDKQRSKAKSVLDDSQKEARGIFAKRAPELEKIEKSLKGGKLDAKQAEAEKKRLLAPVAEIFERLKARLQGLLTQEQITAQTTSAPAVGVHRPARRRGR